MPLQWAALRAVWPTAPENERAALRAQWQQQLGGVLAALPPRADAGAMDGDAAAALRASAGRHRAAMSTLTTMHNATITHMASIARMGGNNVTVRYR